VSLCRCVAVSLVTVSLCHYVTVSLCLRRCVAVCLHPLQGGWSGSSWRCQLAPRGQSSASVCQRSTRPSPSSPTPCRCGNLKHQKKRGKRNKKPLRKVQPSSFVRLPLHPHHAGTANCPPPFKKEKGVATSHPRRGRKKENSQSSKFRTPISCCTVPYCTVLYCTLLYFTVLYCTVICFFQVIPQRRYTYRNARTFHRFTAPGAKTMSCLLEGNATLELVLAQLWSSGSPTEGPTPGEVEVRGVRGA